MDSAVYCHACGARIPAGSAYCSHCGAAQGKVPERRYEIHPVLVAMMLVVFFPVGLILMWTSTDWDSDVKWAITGLIFPPLWLRFLWKVPWLPYAVGALLAAVTLQGAFFGGISVSGALAIVTIIAIVLMMTLGMQRARKPARAEPDAEHRQAVEEKLDVCDDLIADIEADLSLEMLPPGSPLRKRYARALEMRADGRDLLQRATTQRELLEAEGRITGALRDLRSIRDGIADQGPP